MTERHRPLRVRLVQEMGMVSISALLALLIWLIASNQNFETITVPVQVRLVGTPDNVEVQVQREVEMRVSLPANLRDIVGSGDFEIPIDTSDLESSADIDRFATVRRLLLPTDVRATRDLPQTIRAEEIIPRELTISARLITGSFEVRPRIQGEPARGHHVAAEPEVTPVRIWLTASREAVGRATQEAMVLFTDAVDLTGRTAGHHIFTPDIDIPEGFRIVGYQETETSEFVRVQDGRMPDHSVVVAIVEDTLQRTIPGCRGSGPEGRLTILRRDLIITQQEPEEFSVVISGPASLVESIVPADIEITAPPLLDRDSPAEELAVQVRARLRTSLSESVRQGVEILGIEPSNRVVVTIEQVTPPAGETEPTPGLPSLPVTTLLISPEAF